MSSLLKGVIQRSNCPGSILRGNLVSGFSLRDTRNARHHGLQNERLGYGVPVMMARHCSGSSIVGSFEQNSTADLTKSVKNSLDIRGHSVSSEWDNLPSQRHKHMVSDIFLAIRESATPKEVLAVYKSHKDVMDNQHTMAVMEKLRISCNDEMYDSIKLHSTHDFQDLCHKIFVNCRRLDINQLINLLKCLNSLQVDSESKITQTTLQMIKYLINDTDIQQVIFLEYLLTKMSKTPLVDVLLDALPLIAENLLTQDQLKRIPLENLVNIIKVCNRDFKVSNVAMVMEEIYKRGGIRNIDRAVSLLWNLTEMKIVRSRRMKRLPKQVTHIRKILMTESFELYAKNILSFNQKQIVLLLRRVSLAFENGDTSSYNESFLNAVSKYAIKKIRGLSAKEIAHIITSFINMKYHSEELVHCMVDQIVEYPQDFREANVPVWKLLKSIAACEHLNQIRAHDAVSILLDNKFLTPDEESFNKEHLLCIAVELCAVGFYHHKLIDKLMDPTYLSLLPSSDSNLKSMLHVHLAVTELSPPPYSPGIPEAFLERGRSVMRSEPPIHSDLKIMLHKILGGSDRLLSGIVTNNNINIDHLVVLDEAGQPVQLKPKETETTDAAIRISSVEIPANYLRIAILDFGNDSTYTPNSNLLGSLRLKQKLLEAEGFKVVQMLQSVISRYQQEEKVLYIERELMDAGLHF